MGDVHLPDKPVETLFEFQGIAGRRGADRICAAVWYRRCFYPFDRVYQLYEPEYGKEREEGKGSGDKKGGWGAAGHADQPVYRGIDTACFPGRDSWYIDRAAESAGV